MATKKPKTTAKAKNAKAKSTHESKTAVKSTTKVVAPAKTNKVEKEIKAKKSGVKAFFAKKYEGNDDILVIFKKKSLYGALLAEVLGTMLLTMLLIALTAIGMHFTAMYAFGIIAILVAVFSISKANLNPIVTAGMVATRRMSVIRGVLYILAQIVGAWLGWLIFNAFHLAGGESAGAMPTMTAIADGKWTVVMLVELLGATIIGFFFNRALAYQKSPFTFAGVVTGGIVSAIIIGLVVSGFFLRMSNNFIFNPAIALTYQILPTAGANFGEIFGKICSALGAYMVFPMIGGIVGGYLADLMVALSSEDEK